MIGDVARVIEKALFRFAIEEEPGSSQNKSKWQGQNMPCPSKTRQD